MINLTEVILTVTDPKGDSCVCRTYYDGSHKNLETHLEKAVPDFIRQWKTMKAANALREKRQQEEDMPRNIEPYKAKIPFEKPTEQEMQRIVQGYRDAIGNKEPQQINEAYSHGYHVGELDKRGKVESWQFDLIEQIKKKS